MPLSFAHMPRLPHPGSGPGSITVYISLFHQPLQTFKYKADRMVIPLTAVKISASAFSVSVPQEVCLLCPCQDHQLCGTSCRLDSRIRAEDTVLSTPASERGPRSQPRWLKPLTAGPIVSLGGAKPEFALWLGRWEEP